jgi:pimeloyl-ACP methyl ester carboxylesterase
MRPRPGCPKVIGGRWAALLDALESAALALVIGWAACAGERASAAPGGPRTDAPAAGSVELPLAGFLPAIVSWPTASERSQPLLIAAHGAGDTAEAQCAYWRALLGPTKGVVACPRGRPIRAGSEAHGYFYPSHFALEKEVLALLAALEPRAAFVELRDILYAGYSQGATMGMLMLVGHGDRIPHLLLIEGGTRDWSSRRARRFARGGGKHVSFACGTPSCDDNSERAARVLTAAGIASSRHHVPGAGHVYDGLLRPKVEEAFQLLTKGDRRWAN